MKKKCLDFFKKIKLSLSSERGEIGDSFMVIIVIGVAAILMFIFPLMSVSERNDDIAQSVVQTATSEFVDTVAVVGAIKPSDYEAFTRKTCSYRKYI